MRLLILGLNYAPEPVGIGRYTGELASWLAARGHQLQVITAPPYYPQWQLQPPFRNRYAVEHTGEFGQGSLLIRRCPLWVPHLPSTIKRLVHLASFAFSSAFPLLGQLRHPPDKLLVIAPAFCCTVPALLFTALARLRGRPVPAVLHIQDFELDAAFELGFLAGGPVRTCAEAIERVFLQGFTAVSTISPAMCARLALKGVASRRIWLFPNWVDCAAIEPLASPAQLAWRQELAIPADAVVALYSGSMNCKQGLEVLADTALQLADHPRLHWIFCGEGPTRAAFEAACGSLPRVRFLPLQPAECFSALLQLADIHLLPQQAGAADVVMPSKLLAMLASGRPVLATAERQTGLAAVITGASPCGMVTPPGDANSLAVAARELADNPALRSLMGGAARQRALRDWDRDAVLSKFEDNLINL
ncbi:WcaI family glycosyltransferase [Synechococcus sp. CS-1325]|uniref:WcaI family glycosyltransferase n=1 Tax=unclassified Synechococcus TaxID=2626047 RepID=UPI0021A46A6E|nr:MULTISPECIES: WcaI family glycosyltransferase [unclassified Synechococcus]MCT0200805.1 WcaI family glycosyltransferase [Synechococcus sp. CS-1325]MCT0213844.1 WcaI family glycosyltransferase [Synechococcus sp. CS-1326]MCT0233420.1 WcaI family glycosyltransferase [Synechococcus sp. CS-1327]